MTSRRLTLTLAVCLGVAAAAWTNGSAAWAADPTVGCRPAPPAAENATVTRQVYAQAIRDGVSPRVLLATFEAAWVESRLNNCSNGDLDSMGVFQQRASWGSADARTTVATATHAFVVRAKNVDATSAPSVTAGQIAQKVQASAYPDRYDQAQGTATALLNAYGVTNGAGTRMIGPNAYMDVSNSGQIYAWSSRYLGGSPGGYSGRFTDAKVTTGDNGYWLLTSAGQIYAYGNAPYLGGGAAGHTGDLVALAATPNDQGYVMLSASGQVYAYGNAGYFGGSPAGAGGEFTDIEMTPTGRGYWLLTSAGQVYAYGDAGFFGGSPGGFTRAITAMSPTPDGRGYVLVSKTGQVYAYGNASFKGGSPVGVSGEITDISYTPGSGYLLISSSGQHYGYGDAPFIGNPSGANPF
ncbi:hypothetical protein GCM10010172_48880 [Paractinoplanes ferrugineus]|uniref:Uncharacterized protein n=1 Tax=Paractinoplanes ferrugineus TaxID=113564 RepID=A0A919JA87_9ACTN|nr:hypothetical protein [Actinoplanes ferrugineus]GIE16167.1 hypothetical protein Afe05nite_80070 [Actinoplanes ferrugineus]